MNRQSERVLRDRIAEEAQLLAEEKWIIEALTKIKQQKNSLQVERLQLESLESKLKQKLDENHWENRNEATPDDSHSTKTETRNPANLRRTQNSLEFEEPLISDNAIRNFDLDSCNDEELDLAVSKSVFSQEIKENVLEEYEEEDDDDMYMDMNVFMNAKNAHS